MRWIPKKGLEMRGEKSSVNFTTARFAPLFFARKAIQRQAKFIPPFRQKATRHNNVVLSFRVERCDGGKISVVFLVTLVSAQRLNSRWKLQSREMDNGELRWMLIQQFACWHRHWSAARDKVSSARDAPLLSIHWTVATRWVIVAIFWYPSSGALSSFWVTTVEGGEREIERSGVIW